jgi:hypothetical protein
LLCSIISNRKIDEKNEVDDVVFPQCQSPSIDVWTVDRVEAGEAATSELRVCLLCRASHEAVNTSHAANMIHLVGCVAPKPNLRRDRLGIIITVMELVESQHGGRGDLWRMPSNPSMRMGLFRSPARGSSIINHQCCRTGQDRTGQVRSISVLLQQHYFCNFRCIVIHPPVAVQRRCPSKHE